MGDFFKGWRRKVGSYAIGCGVGSLLCIVSCYYVVIPAFGTIQIRDHIVIGSKTYNLEEIPMLGLWDYDEGKPAEGKEKLPRFDIPSSANWSGYQAKFEIRDSKLWLKKITGKIDGTSVKNDRIIPGEKFPIVAKWYSGRIHVEVGDFDEKTQEATFVIIFHIEKGAVTKTEYAERMKRVRSWNGLPTSDEPKATE